MIIEIVIDITVRPHLRLELHPPLVGPSALLRRHLLQLLQLVSLLRFCKMNSFFPSFQKHEQDVCGVLPRESIICTVQ